MRTPPRRFFLYLLACSVLLHCGKAAEQTGTGDGAQETTSAPTGGSVITYENPEFTFALEFPAKWKLVKSSQDGRHTFEWLPADEVGRREKVLGLHESQALQYILVIPDGLSTELPAGARSTLQQTDIRVPKTGFTVDAQRSVALQLADGQPWGYWLVPQSPPASWGPDGFVFVQYAVTDGEIRCYDTNGTEKPAGQCDPLGDDRLVRSGRVDQASRQTIDAILASWSFDTTLQQPIGDLIQIETPLPEADVTSPLSFSGEARGYYFFEADFPVRLEDEAGNVLAQTVAGAQSGWMTEDWVPFTGSLEFDAPEAERGYLVFERANPSGLEEHARSFRLPVLFPPAGQ